MTPILYTFRRCPYAIRARLALKLAGVDYQHREVLLRDKPAEMLAISPKGTVPVLQLKDRVIDESLDIARWALSGHDLKDELDHSLVADNDGEFKYFLDRYKYYDRYPEYSQSYYLECALPFLKTLDESLCKSADGHFYLISPKFSPLDLAILPFVRQFAMADNKQFDSLGLRRLACWLEASLASELFQAVMIKTPRWFAHE